MLTVETIAKIRRLHFTEGKGIKTTRRDLKLSKKVARKMTCIGTTEFTHCVAAQVMTVTKVLTFRLAEALQRREIEPALASLAAVTGMRSLSRSRSVL